MAQWRRPYALVRLIGGRWTLVVLGELAAGGLRFQDFHDVLDGVSHKVLTGTLRRAERGSLIRRHLDSGERALPPSASSPLLAGCSLSLPGSAVGRRQLGVGRSSST